MYFSYNGTRDCLKIEWRDQSCMRLEVVSALPLCLRFMRNGTVWASFFSANSFFCCFSVMLAQPMRFPFEGRITKTEPCDWICLLKYCYNSEILVAAFLFGQSSSIQNAYFLIENCLPRPSRIKFDAITPSESAVAPKSLQSRTLLSLVLLMSGAAFGPGLPIHSWNQILEVRFSIGDLTSLPYKSKFYRNDTISDR